MTETYEDIKGKHTGANGAAEVPLPSRALSYAQLQALPEPDYVVKGVIDQGALGEIYGPWGSGKSFLGLDIGMHVALGWSWHHRRVKQGGVLYIAAEGGKNIVRRMAAFAKHHSIDPEATPFRVVLASTNMLTANGIAQVIADTGPIPNLIMIIVDTASRTMPGSKEDTEDMGKFVAACDEVRASTGAAVVVVHHSGKNPDRGSRGSVVLPAAADAMLELSIDDKDRALHTAELVKARDGATGAKHGFRLLVIPLGEDSDGDGVTSCIVEHVDEVGTKGANLTDDERAFLGDIIDYFARAETRTESLPMSVAGRAATRGARRDDIRDWLKSRGRFSVAGNVALTGTDRSTLTRTLNHLRDKGKLGMTDQFIWLVQ